MTYSGTSLFLTGTVIAVLSVLTRSARFGHPLGMDDFFSDPEPAPAGPVTPGKLDEVERRMVDAALGVTLETVVELPNGGVTRTTAQRAPDIAAGKALLAAYRPDRYSVAQAGPTGLTVVVLTMDELRQRRAGQAVSGAVPTLGRGSGPVLIASPARSYAEITDPITIGQEK